VDRDCVAVQKSRSPIDAWPEAFIFFDRVLGLLRGLTASMEVKQVHTKVDQNVHRTPRNGLPVQPQPHLAVRPLSVSCQSYLEVMTPFARLALREHERKVQLTAPRNAPPVEPAIDATCPDVRGADRLGGVAAILQELVGSGDILGAQVTQMSHHLGRFGAPRHAIGPH